MRVSLSPRPAHSLEVSPSLAVHKVGSKGIGMSESFLIYKAPSAELIQVYGSLLCVRVQYGCWLRVELKRTLEKERVHDEELDIHC